MGTLAEKKKNFVVETMAGNRRETPLQETRAPYNDSKVTKCHFGGQLPVKHLFHTSHYKF